MTEDQTTTPAEETTGDDPGKETEEKSVRDLIAELGTDDLDELLLAAVPEKFVAKDKVEDIVKERLNSEREQRKAEAERKALEEQNQFKELYEQQKERAEQLEADKKASDELARTRLINNELKLALRDKGARTDRIDRLVRDADLSSIEIDGEEVKGLDPVVASLEKGTPEWFSAHSEEPQDLLGSPPAGDREALTQEQKESQKALAAQAIHSRF